MAVDKSTGIREYERVRKYMEHIYLFGFLNGNELAEMKGYSKKDYDKMLPFMEKVLHFDINIIDKKHYRFIKRNYGEDCDRSLADTYMIRAIKTNTHLLQYLFILSKATKKSENNYRRLCDDLEYIYGDYNEEHKNDNGLSEEELDKNEEKLKKSVLENCKNRIIELTKAGYIKQDCYNQSYITTCVELDKLSTMEIEQLYDYVGFISKISHPKVAGSFLHRALKRVLFLNERFKTFAANTKKEAFATPYIIRNNSNHNIFDEELVYQIFDAIAEVRDENDEGIGYKDLKIVRLNGNHFIPMELRYDTRFGRWFVWGATKNEYKGHKKLSFTIYPLSAVTSLEIDKESNERWEIDNFEEEVERIIRVSRKRLYSGSKNITQDIKVQLLFGESKEGQAAKEQFVREKYFGKIDFAENLYKASLFDPIELHPWIRSFSPWLKVIPYDRPEIYQRSKDSNEIALNLALCKSLEAMRKALLESEYPEPKPRKLSPNKLITQEPGLFNRFQSQNMQFALELLCRLSCGPLKYSTILQIAAEDFGLQYSDINIIKDILDLLENLEFIICKNKVYYINNADIPKMFLGNIESDYLCYIMSLPEANLFLSDETKDKIEKNLIKVYESDESRRNDLIWYNNKILPKWSKYIKCFSPKGGVMPNRDTFSCVLHAIKRNYFLEYKLSDKSDLKTIYPWKIEYDASDRTFWIIGYDADSKKIIRFLLNDIVYINYAGIAPNLKDEIKRVLDEHKIRIKIHIIDRFNALKRAFLMFENEEFVESRRVGEHEYELIFNTMDYYKDELIRKLMHLGENVVLIDGPKGLKEELLERIEKALSNNRTNANSETKTPEPIG